MSLIRLGRGLGLLPARSLRSGVLGFDVVILATCSLPLCRQPAADFSQAFRVLAVSLVPAPRLVLASAIFVQTGARARAALSGLGTALYFNVVVAHGRSISQRQARGECVTTLPGRYQNANKTIAYQSKAV